MADRRKYYREYRRHKEEYREYARQWREKNPEKVKLMKERSLARTPNTKKRKPSAAKNREYQRRYRRRHSQKISEKNRKWREANREKLRSYYRIYRENHPELKEKNRLYQIEYRRLCKD